jgi:hypothetical protein
MATDAKTLFANPAINEWRLFWLVTLLVSGFTTATMATVDLSQAADISVLIQYSVRWSVPWLYLAFMASSLQVVYPSLFSRWLARNRKYFGLCFASAMAWQLLFILWMVALHYPYYAQEVYNLSDTIEGVGGYLVLIAMVLTSFPSGRKRLTAKQWRYLHKFGMYYLWGYAWSVYWYELYYYEAPLHPIDHAFYWTGFLAWGLRIWAWTKKELKRSERAGVKKTA